MIVCNIIGYYVIVSIDIFLNYVNLMNIMLYYLSILHDICNIIEYIAMRSTDIGCQCVILLNIMAYYLSALNDIMSYR